MLRHLLLLFTFCLLLVTCLPAQAQRQIRVRGTILQPDKTTPIPGAGIIKVGNSTGVASDQNGNFLIDIQTEDTLLIRAVGYKPVLYLPQKLLVSEVRVNIVMQEDSVMLGEVLVTTRPSEEMIQRALRNMKRAEPNYTTKPGYDPAFNQPPPTVTAPAPAALTPFSIPVSMIFDMLSKEGKQNRQLQELLEQQELEKRINEKKKEREDYNRFFKDNKGYE
ncbi:carboxypeptidase-like regulatory domain-containing protein [Pontibacter sp. SGAir0037]|uniref:carboxypeptidase-like regulatory domain-containing protein n=1 Tax=Pontibacter sp. SGAir0037 TaxID=2571030 RepID=UPI0010CD52DB|nr:carboxypeptidase-like regulatory domain-containing protein [Pontibacter sp. SGAir0037]QCR23568.1 hypothetical protein C1N53_15265 [Pontibacter sp. SGAir0037]